MYRVNNIKQGILIVSLATLITGCGGGGSATTSTGATVSNLSPATASNLSPATASNLSPATASNLSLTTAAPSSKAVHTGQVKDNVTGEDLENVKVSIGSHTTTTDVNGYYILPDLIENEETVVNFEKAGYLLGSTNIQLKSFTEDDTVSPNYLIYSMYSNISKWTYDSNDEVNGPHIMIDASVSYNSINRKSYTGTNTAELTYFDITSDKGKASFPGAFKGINSNGTMVQFETYGLISILLKDNNGNRLHLAENETATLRFDAVSSLEKPDTLPLWYYDYDQGLWFEKGYAQLQSDGSYKGEISHLGTWSINRVIEEEPGIYQGRIIDKDGSPMNNVRLQAIGDNWISSDLSTDEDGVFEIEVIPGKSFKLSAYDYKNKFGANYDGIISAIVSGDIVDE